MWRLLLKFGFSLVEGKKVVLFMSKTHMGKNNGKTDMQMVKQVPVKEVLKQWWGKDCG